MILTVSGDRTQRWWTVACVYGSGLLAGIALILFPSAGPIFRGQYQLSSSQYGVLFTPQTIAAIGAGLVAGRLAQRWGMRTVLRGGLFSLLLALGLAVLSAAVPSAFPVLLLATTCVGAGFSLTITALNAYAFDLFRGQENAAITGIHVMAGIGQFSAALLLSLVTQGGVYPERWWGAPLLIAGLIMVMAIAQLPLPLQLTAEASPTPTQERLPGRVWIYALLVLIYGALEGTLGNFTPLYLRESAQLSMANAALGLSLFWGAVTTGRVLFTALALRVNPHFLYYLTPLIVGAVLFSLPALQGTAAHFIALITLGLALSFFFPYSISLASNENPALTATISGLMVAAIQLGNGLSSNVIGLANESLDLRTIFQGSALYTVIMLVGILALAKGSNHARS